MQGTILSVASQGGQGLILGDDGVRYTYTPLGWRDASMGVVQGMRVDFEVRGAHAVGIYPAPGAAAPPVQPQQPVQHQSTFPAAPAPPVQPQQPVQHQPTFPAAPAPPVQPQQPVHPPPAYPSAPTPTAPAPPRSPVPATNTSSSWARPKVLVGALVAIVIVGFGAYLLYQETRSDEDIALSVARGWTGSSIDDISELAMGLLVGNAPVITQIGGDVLADRIRDEVTWSYSTPYCPYEGRCEVTATARADLDISIPLVFNDTVTVELPFDLDIDTEGRQVTDWTPNVLAASVSGIELRGAGRGVQQAVNSSSEEVRRAVRRVQQIAEDEGVQTVFNDTTDKLWEIAADEDVQRTIRDASDTIRSFANDEDVQRTFRDTSDTIRSFADDEDVQRTFRDTSDTIRSFADDEDVQRTIRDTSDAVQSGIKSFFGD